MYLSLSLLIIAGISKAFMDKLSAPDHFIGTWLYWSRGRWLNDKLSTAGNKWKEGDPSLGEAFPGSSTILVWTTDAWHFFQAIFLNCFSLAGSLPFSLNISLLDGLNPIMIELIEFSCFKILITGSFQVVFTILTRKK